MLLHLFFLCFSIVLELVLVLVLDWARKRSGHTLKNSDDAESLLTEAPSNSFDPQNRVRGRVRVRGRLKLQIALRYSDSSVSKRSTRRVSIATTRQSISLPA